MRNATAPKYRADIAAYSLRHYGVSASQLNPRAVVLHFTVSDAGSWRGIVAGWDVASATGSGSGAEDPQPAAHFIIEQDGTIYQTMPLDLRVRHAYGVNDSAIGIEFIERSSASNILARPLQLQAGLALVRWLQYEYRIAATNIMGHATVNSHPLFHDLTGMRNTHVDWNAGEVAQFTAALGDVPMKDAGPGSGSVTKVHAGPANATVLGNLTAVSPQSSGFTQVFDCARGRPTASVTSIFSTLTTPTMALATTDSQGDVCIYNSAQTHLLWDQYFAGTTLTGHPPIRLLNTLEASATRQPGPLPAGQSIAIQTGQPGRTIMGTLTAWMPAGSGHMRVYPCSEGLPSSSNLNFVRGLSTANFVTVRADANGRVCVYTSATSHAVWDQVAEVADPIAHPGIRTYDARTVTPSPSGTGGRNLPGEVVRIKAADSIATVFGNLTVANPLGSGHTVVYPCGTPLPPTSVNNFVAGRNSSNAVMVRTDANGWVCAKTSAAAHLVWDQFAESTTLTAATPTRLLDTRR